MACVLNGNCLYSIFDYLFQYTKIQIIWETTFLEPLTKRRMNPINVVVLGNTANEKYRKLEMKLPREAVNFAESESVFRDLIEDTNVLFYTGHYAAKPLKNSWNRTRCLRWIHTASAGVEDLLFPELVESPVLVTNSKGLYNEALAEFVVGAILHFAKRFDEILQNQRNRQWQQLVVSEIKGKTLGIVGLGSVGRTIAKKASCLGMNLVECKRSVAKSDRKTVNRTFPADQLTKLLRLSDVVALSVPLTNETRGMIGWEQFQLMKKEALLINVCPWSYRG